MTASSDKVNYGECCLHDQNCGAFKQNQIIEQLSGAGAEWKHGYTLQISQGKSILEFLYIWLWK